MIPAFFLVAIAVFVAFNYILVMEPGPPYLYGLVGNDGTHLQEEQKAGINAKIVRISWREYYPMEGQKDTSYIQSKKEEIEKLRAAGFNIIIDLGYHDTPPWVHQNYSNSYYVDQFGERYLGDTFSNGTPIDNGDANLVFNKELRDLVSSYMKDFFSDFGTDFYAVRAGGGYHGELTYPPASYTGQTNLYWAYDQNALASSPAPSWRPGQSSPNGEAGRFLDWYLDSLANYQNWQVSVLRKAGYGGRVMVLYPSWGIRPGQIDEAVAGNLDGSTSAEQNSEVQRGHDFERQVKAIEDQSVVVTTTWLDADARRDADKDLRYWSPVHYLASLARASSLTLELYGENTGQGDRAEMELSASQMRCYGLVGMAWYNEDELFSGHYATLEDYEQVIEAPAGKGTSTIADTARCVEIDSYEILRA